MRKLMFAVILFVAAVMVVGCDDYKAPTSLRDAFYDRYPTAVDVEWEKKRGYQVAEFHIPGQQGECEAWYKRGVWVMTKYDIAYSELPQVVRTAFESSYGAQSPVDDVERLERSNGSTLYFIETEVVINGILTEVDLDYDEDGTLLRETIDVFDYDNIYYYI